MNSLIELAGGVEHASVETTGLEQSVDISLECREPLA